MRALDCSAAKSKRRKPPTLEAGPVRKSQRLIAKQKQSESEINLPSKTKLPIDVATSLLSPPPSCGLAKSRKRKQPSSKEETSQAKKARILQTDDPIEWWAHNQDWPPWFAKMSKDQPSMPSKRKSSSTHNSDHVAKLIQHDVFMEESPILIDESKLLCTKLQEGEHKPSDFPSYPLEDITRVLRRVQTLNEARLYRDITPWVVPSAENLYFRGDLEIDYIGEELQAEWTRCKTMGSTKPRPDYVAGLQRKAFTKDETEKLQNYTTLERPFLFTPNICFPFLICEAKTGLIGMDNAKRQNIHSGSIAVAAIITLFQNAFSKDSDEVKGLFGKILVFTVSHDNSIAKLYGHCALADNNARGFACYYHEIALYSLTINEGRDRYKMYNFTVNLYRDFAPEHLKRIQKATAKLPEPEPRTSLSFDASQMELGDTNSQPNSEGQILPPPVPSSEVSKLQRQRKKDQEDAKKQIDILVKQLDQQREDAKQQNNILVEQLKQQKEQMERLMKLLEKKA
ncbi:MAG: hypothetical protein M1814_000713 [Vezdaea aestivalis]|nr:MAG: hypothetical protein M1814_000713 [Vezdaea aestivalis]